jgi:prepilin signal peptidase PulO-like enzyme (type II secretory pathway)
MIEIFGYALIFVGGLFVGSFLNVVADRVPHKKSPLKGRSKCDYCKADLKAKDLIPLLSYAWLKAKCRYCEKKLSLYYPFAEVITGLAFVGVAYYLKVFAATNPYIWINFAYLAVIASFLIVIFLTDVKYKLIPNKIVFPAILFMLIFMIGSFIFIAVSSYTQMKADPFGKYLLEVGYWSDQMMFLLRSLVFTVGSALLLGGFFWLLIFITKGKGMGGGDVKLAFLIGLINGFPFNIIAIVLAFVIGAAVSGVLMMFKKKGMKDVIPFGPFLITGSVVAFVFGQQLLNWYVGLL